MSVAHQTHERYRTERGSYEWLVRVGDPRTPPVLFVPPLLEEMNRTRALLLAVMRALALEGHSAWLPDLSGTGDSPVALAETRWQDWRDDVASAASHVAEAAGRPPLIASIRGGCLLDDTAQGDCRWRFAPVAGASLARDLDRAALGGGAEWAGYHDAAVELRTAIASAIPADVTPLRTLRLSTDAGAADAKVEGPALWRRSEPGRSDALAAALARDIGEWRRSCGDS